MRTTTLPLPLDQQLEHLDLRTERLLRFLTIACHNATREPTNPWWSWHVAWTLRRLESIGYTFPEVDPAPLSTRRLERLAGIAA